MPASHLQVAERPDRPPASQQVGGAASGQERPCEGAEKVEQGALARRCLAVAGPRDLRRLDRRLLGRPEHVVRLLGKRSGAPAPDASVLDCRQGGQSGRGYAAEDQRAPVRFEPGPPPPPVQRSSRSSSETSRTCRAGTPITTARAGTSRVTTAPAATNASSPTSTPGTTTTPPPTRQARRSTAPRRVWSGPWRPIVSSLVRVTPGATKTSSSMVEKAVM